MANDEIISGYYQVNSKPLGDFNIDADRVYQRTLHPENANCDTNFGALAKMSEVPVANNISVGGVMLYDLDQLGGDESTIGNPDAKNYAIKLNDNNCAYVHVPWINTTYMTDGQCLCTTTISEQGKESGGIFEFGLREVPVTKISGAGNMLSGEYSNFERISCLISQPLNDTISTEVSVINDAMQIIDYKVDELSLYTMLSIDELCTCIDDNYYLNTETSSKEEISAALSSLSNDVENYLYDKNKNPAYLQDETSSDVELANMFNSISGTVNGKFMLRTAAYLCTETSSNIELANMFNKKQNSLTIHDSIYKKRLYTNNDVPDVKAVVDFVATELDVFNAVFFGNFSSWNDVPATSAWYKQYKGNVPNLNDYIYVTTKKDDGSGATEVGVCKFKMFGDWDDNKGRSNWVFECKINDTPFTDDQLNALNSGATTSKIDQIETNRLSCSTINSNFNKLKDSLGELAYVDKIPNVLTGNGQSGKIAAFNGTNSLYSIDFSPTTEQWTFEDINGNTFKKRMIVQNT